MSRSIRAHECIDILKTSLTIYESQREASTTRCYRPPNGSECLGRKELSAQAHCLCAKADEKRLRVIICSNLEKYRNTIDGLFQRIVITASDN